MSRAELVRCPCGGPIELLPDGAVVIHHEDNCIHYQSESYCHDNRIYEEARIQAMIDRRDWQALDAEFSAYQDVGRTVIIYKLLKALIEKAGK